VAAAVVAAFVVVTLRWFVWPDTEPVAEADAVVVLSGSPERLPKGQALLADGIAPTLAASRGPSATARADCDASAIVCFRADPLSTVGEARRIAQLADAREWDELAVVTSTFHLVRARTLIEQCYGGELTMVDAGRSSRRSLAWAIPHEWAGLAAGVTVQRAC
jgi:uncharacterized SAM-binding protein YcdF (DUF218 family)